MQSYSYKQIANDWNLWREYADTSAIYTVEQFDAATEAQKIGFLEGCFGRELPSGLPYED